MIQCVGRQIRVCSIVVLSLWYACLCVITFKPILIPGTSLNVVLSELLEWIFYGKGVLCKQILMPMVIALSHATHHFSVCSYCCEGGILPQTTIVP